MIRLTDATTVPMMIISITSLRQVDMTLAEAQDYVFIFDQ